MTRLRDQVAQVLGDETLQAALSRALATVRGKSRVALAELADSEAVREAAGQARRRGINRLGPRLEQLEAALVAGGTTVHWAESGRDAVQVVARLARDRDVLRTVLSKSMTGEEIDLEEGLRRAGVDVVQTDLGERVVQLAGQRPSHITAPCLHLSAAQVGEILQQKSGLEYSDDPEKISRLLAYALRPRFLEGQMGITGVNFAIAATGSLVLVENEGNVRFGYTLPRYHVAVVGIEKVVGDLQEALLYLSLLPRLATGQRTTCYVSFLPSAPLPGQERHVVLVDNGRSELFNAGPFRDLLRCIRCASCMNVCPVYEKVGGHAYGWVYPGPLGIALSSHWADDEVAAAIPDLCSLCGACTDVCPVGIPLDRLILLARVRARPRKPADQAARERRAMRWFRRAMGGRTAYGLSHWAHLRAHWAPATYRRVMARLGWWEHRAPPSPAPTLFRTWFARRRKGES